VVQQHLLGIYTHSLAAIAAFVRGWGWGWKAGLWLWDLRGEKNLRNYRGRGCRDEWQREITRRLRRFRLLWTKASLRDAAHREKATSRRGRIAARRITLDECLGLIARRAESKPGDTYTP